MQTVLEVALQLAASGFPVFPCGAHKKPVIAKKNGGSGYEDAVVESGQIKALFDKAPAARLVGVPTGAITGFDILDVDYRNGGGAWEDDNVHRLPETRVHQTMSGGKHYVFKHAEGVRLNAGKIALGIDIRGDGGYVVMPPSDGYTVISDAEPADWPDWLLEAVLARPVKNERPPSSGRTSQLSSARTEGLIRAIIARVTNAQDGQKHHVLRNAALSLGGIVDAAGLGESEAVDMLVTALPASVEDWVGAKRTAEWGVKQGRLRPLELEDRPYQNGQAQAFEAPPLPPELEPSSPPPVETPGRPVITVFSGLRHKAADAGLEALAAARVPFYQRDKAMVRAAMSKAKTSDGKVIEVPSIVNVTLPILGRALGSVAEWQRVNAEGEPRRIDPPKDVVEQIAAMTGDWPFPPIAGVIGTQTMRPDGTILDIQGYDDMTGLVLVAPPPMPSIPAKPTKHDANMAIEELQFLLKDFPFADETSRSVALSMILTTVLRGALLPAVPMHVATAPQPGTGKSYLSDIASAISTGERCAVIAQAPNPEETEKRLIGAALSGQPIIAIDNVSEMLAGDFLNQVTERPLLQLRALGSSDPKRIANTFTVFANGNNLSAPADLVRRTLVCRLDANMENPEEREFDFNPVRNVLSDRGRYVAACLTIGRAYIVAGSPDKCRQLASFERWSDLVRSAIVWLGMPDPCQSMDLARSEDPIRAARAALFSAWERELSLLSHEFSTRELATESERFGDDGFLHPDFREACLAIAAERSGLTISTRKLGKWLSDNKNNRVGDLKLTANLNDAARPRWKLVKV